LRFLILPNKFLVEIPRAFSFLPHHSRDFIHPAALLEVQRTAIALLDRLPLLIGFLVMFIKASA